MMQRICAYCRRNMGESMGPDGMATHGICISCAELSEDERAWEIDKYGRCLTAEERRDAANLKAHLARCEEGRLNIPYVDPEHHADYLMAFAKLP